MAATARPAANVAMKAVFAAVVLGSAAERVWLTRSSWFYLDDWPLIVQSGHGGGFLQPYNGHLSPILLGVYRLQMEAFGFGAYLPLRIVATVALLAVPVAMYLALRRQRGDVYAVVVALFFVWFHGMTLEPAALNHYLSLAFGIGFAWALSLASTPRSDALVAALLTLSLCSAGSGVAVAAGGGAYLLGTRSPRRRWAAVLLPSAAWAIWWLRYVGHTTLAPGNTPLDGPPAVARSVAENLFGTFQQLGLGNRVLGAILLAGFLARSVAVLCDDERDGSGVLAWSAALVVWWVGLALSRGSGASAGLGFRYAYVGSGFLALTLFTTARDKAVPAVARSPGRAGVAVPIGSVMALAAVLAIAVQGDLRTSADRLAQAGCTARLTVALADQGPKALPDDTIAPITMYLIRAGQIRKLTARYGHPFGTTSSAATVAQRDCA